MLLTARNSKSIDFSPYVPEGHRCWRLGLPAAMAARNFAGQNAEVKTAQNCLHSCWTVDGDAGADAHILLAWPDLCQGHTVPV